MRSFGGIEFRLVPNLHLGSATAELHTMIADIKGMREMAVLTPCGPDSHWHDRFGSLRLSFGYARSKACCAPTPSSPHPHLRLRRRPVPLRPSSSSSSGSSLRRMSAGNERSDGSGATYSAFIRCMPNGTPRLGHDRVQSLAGSGIANSDDAVSSVFVTPESMSELTCRTSNRIIDFSHAEGCWASLSIGRCQS